MNKIIIGVGEYPALCFHCGSTIFNNVENDIEEPDEFYDCMCINCHTSRHIDKSRVDTSAKIIDATGIEEFIAGL